MLVLTRKTGEQIFIDKNIAIMILGAKRKAVRIGVQAPAEVLVRRGEVVKRRASVKAMDP